MQENADIPVGKNFQKKQPLFGRCQVEFAPYHQDGHLPLKFRESEVICMATVVGRIC